jgi:AcrR family transcriptional regulator
MPQPRRRAYAARLPLPARKEQLLDAALAVIERDGYAGVSIDAIAAEAGVTRPVVYSAYAGLAPLLEALLDRQEARALGQIMAALPTDLASQPAADLVATAVERLATAVARDPTTWRPILLAGTHTPAVVRERIDRDRETIRVRIEALLRAGLHPSVDAELASHAIIGVLEHIGRLAIQQPGKFPAARLVALTRQVVVALQRATGPSASR